MTTSWHGSTRAWRRVRAQVLERDSYICKVVANKAKCQYVATEVHHVLGKAFGDDPAYLLASCSWCNKHLGSPQSDLPNKQISDW